jgi:hypothetical protein
MFQISEAHVTEAEYEAATIFHSVVYGPDGLTRWLGPMWAMVQDPRFTDIDMCFYRERAAVFGGNASVGVQHVTEDNVIDMGSSAEGGALAEYATIIGEGRHFVKVVGKDEAHKVKDWDDTRIWNLIEQQCPNYKNRKGQWNHEAKVLYQLLKKDLLGLIADYTPHELCADFIKLDTREVVSDPAQEWGEEGAPIVHVEVDSLERSLAFRNQIRITAYRVMKNTPGMEELLQEPLTLTEHDQLLQLIFKIPYRELYRLPMEVRNFMKSHGIGTIPLEERERIQIEAAKTEAADIARKVETGEIEVIRTPIADDNDEGLNEEEKRARILLSNPVLMDMFQIATAAEKRGNPSAIRLLEKLLDEKQELTDDDAEQVRSLLQGNVGVSTVHESFGDAPADAEVINPSEENT